ncbi:AbrB/MazE/SpoVT family DNA-binding domain-containing protein [Fusobacterium ulcerans]|uniref:AbrB/MazE/SpoVT family DNA-binding domain-containing protein n=1 Tax=Fusobacterium ulcerans TaxID=861 RepID=UPI00241DDDD1|nr:AbrB/MazE/SpoVT family DNA-binding domain-containing protein [Fusobacterium ulcerans]
MEKRDLNVSFYKAGNGGEATRITLPKPWLRELGITKEDKAIELIFDKENEQLIIRKKK